VVADPVSSCGDACGSTNPWFRVSSGNSSSTDVSVRVSFGCSSCSPSPCPHDREQVEVGVVTQLGAGSQPWMAHYLPLVSRR
jgi:hypothetical protein